MKSNWIFTSIIFGIIGGIITYFLTWSWKLAVIIGIIVFVIVLIFNPKTRYMKAFYTALFPLLSNIYFTISTKTDHFDIEAGIKELDITTTIILGLICIICLFLDYLERNGKLQGTLIEINRNVNKKVSGNNINIHQNINKKDSSTND